MDLLSPALDMSSEGETEGTSETDMARIEEDAKDFSSPMQLLKDKVKQYRKELHDLNTGVHPEYLKREAKLELAHKEAVRTTECWRRFMTNSIDEEHRKEHASAEKEFETKRLSLKETLEAELGDKRKRIESDRQTMEISGDLTEPKPATTRKLRKRYADQPQQPERRKRTANTICVSSYLCEDEEVMADLLRVYKGKLPLSLRPAPVPSSSSPRPHATTTAAAATVSDSGVEIKLQDGKLFYDKKVFIRGQPVFLDEKDGTRISGTVQSIGQNEVWIRKTSGDQGRIKVPLQHLLRGKFSVRKRST